MLCVELESRDKGKFSVFSRRGWLRTRTPNHARRAAVPFNGIVGIDGIPSSIQRRGKVKEQDRRGSERRTGVMNWVKTHPICAVYVVVAFCLGAWWQGWLV